MKAVDLVQKIFDRVSLPVLLIDRDYKIAWANGAARAHVALSDNDVVGCACYEMAHGSGKPCWQSEGIGCPAKEAFETRERVRVIHRHSIGGDLVVEEIVATPLEDGNGEVSHVIEELRDITELLELRQGLLPICAACKKIRDDRGAWLRIEEYIRDHTGADFSHSLCPECLRLHALG